MLKYKLKDSSYTVETILYCNNQEIKHKNYSKLEERMKFGTTMY